MLLLRVNTYSISDICMLRWECIGASSYGSGAGRFLPNIYQDKLMLPEPLTIKCEKRTQQSSGVVQEAMACICTRRWATVTQLYFANVISSIPQNDYQMTKLERAVFLLYNLYSHIIVLVNNYSCQVLTQHQCSLKADKLINVESGLIANANFLFSCRG